MNDFDGRWRECAGRARLAPGRDECAPHGFAARVAAHARAAAPADAGDWFRLGLCSLGAVLAALAVCAALELPHLRDARPLDPGVEDAVARIVWSL